MSDLTEYCDATYTRLTGLKAGLYDVMTKAEEISDSVHSEAAKQLKGLVKSLEAGIAELKNQCPADWSPNKKDLDDKLARLESTLSRMADELGVVIPDSTAWI
jgi:hypothetical protein